MNTIASSTSADNRSADRVYQQAAEPPNPNEQDSVPDTGEGLTDGTAGSFNADEQALADVASLVEQLDAALKEGPIPNAQRLFEFLGVQPGEWTEVQALEVKRWPDARPCAMSAFVESAWWAAGLANDRRDDSVGVYVIGNRLKPAVATRMTRNEWHVVGQNGGTKDGDIAARRMITIDCDAIRESRTSATEDEMAHAVALATLVLGFLIYHLGPGPIGLVHTGNGRMVLLAVDDLPESPELEALVCGIVAGFAQMFMVPGASIDTTVTDAKRLIPLAGTFKCKGAAGIEERPHRQTAIAIGADIERLDMRALRYLLEQIRRELSEDQNAQVDRAMGIKTSPPKEKKSPPRPAPRQGPDEQVRAPADPTSIFSVANAQPIQEVAEWKGLLIGGVLTCPGCGEREGVGFFQNGVKCFHQRCAAKGAPSAPGYRGPVDVVVEVDKVTPLEAAQSILRHFNLAPPRSSPKGAKPRPKPAEVAFERGDQAEVADVLLDVLARDRDHVVHTEGFMWRYAQDKGYWQRVENDELLRIVKSFAGAPIYSSKGNSTPLRLSASSVRGAVDLACSEVHRETFFDCSSRGVAFVNGFVTVGPSGVLVEEHSPDHRCRHGFDFAFDAAAPHPLLDEFFAEVFGDVGEKEARDRTSLIQEFVGAALLGLAPSYRRCLVLVGPRGTAKSQVAEMIQALFPPFAVSSVAPHRWHERFSLSGLVGRALNVVPELPASELLGTDAFKAVVTGDIVGAEHKFRPSFSFKPRAAHLFITNELPATHDFSEAFFGRFLLCRMDRDMLGASSHRIDAARAIIDAERGAMAAWAVSGAERLVRARGYTIPSTSKETTEQWRRDVDNVAVFVDEECRPVLSKGDTAPDGTLAKPLYGAYRGWAYANEYRPISSRKFAHRMRAIGLGAVHTNAGSSYPVVLRCAPQTFDRQYSN